MPCYVSKRGTSHELKQGRTKIMIVREQHVMYIYYFMKWLFFVPVVLDTKYYCICFALFGYKYPQ